MEIIISPDQKELATIKKENPQAIIGLIVSAQDNWQNACERLGAYCLVIPRAIANRGLIEKIHQSGLKAFIWQTSPLSKGGSNALESIGADAIVVSSEEGLALSRLNPG